MTCITYYAKYICILSPLGIVVIGNAQDIGPKDEGLSHNFHNRAKNEQTHPKPHLGRIIYFHKFKVRFKARGCGNAGVEGTF